MRRREFITLVGGAAAAWPLAANAQQKGKLPLVGVLNPGSTDGPAAAGFYEGLREIGYTEGLNIAIERRYGAWNTDRFPQLQDVKVTHAWTGNVAFTLDALPHMGRQDGMRSNLGAAA